MKVISVKFGKYPKEYSYVTDIDMIVGGVYKIATFSCVYGTPVKVIRVLKDHASKTDIHDLKPITTAQCISAPEVPNFDSIKQVYFNNIKGATTICWADGTKTTVRCAQGEVFDKEKGMAMAIAKRYFGNRGAYNKLFQRYCEMEDTPNV